MDEMLKASKKKVKKEKREKKSKKSKKSKKHDKKNKKLSSPSFSSSSSDSEESTNEWVEKKIQPESSKKIDSSLGSEQQRDDWMSGPFTFPCVTRDQLKAAKKPSEKQKEAEAAKYMLDRPGQTGRELNPYWADNGTGLPSEKPVETESLSLNSTTVGDQGVNWLRRALQRAKEQAKESGRSLEDVAAERWGSLKKLEQLISEAESRKGSSIQRRPDEKSRYSQKSRSDDSGRGYNRCDEKQSNQNKQDHDSRHTDASSRRGWYDNNRSFREKSSHHKQYDDTKKSSLTTSTKELDSSGSKHHSFRKESESMEFDKSEGSEQGQDPMVRNQKYSRNQSSHKEQDSYGKFSHSKSEGRSRLGFMKPGTNEDDSKSSGNYRYDGSCKNKNWRKKDVVQNAVEEESRGSTDTKKKMSELHTSCVPSTEYEILPPSVTSQVSEVLTDQQMNELAAKLVKAEIMGNEELVAELQKKLQEAREVRAANPNAVSAHTSQKSEGEVVILSRTDSKGFSRPLFTNSVHAEPSGGRRKKVKAETHAADGQRARYFPDDDKYSLQDMFQREKLTTAEEQNEMFVNLAGKDKRQEHDLDMDDIFAEKAQVKESDGKIEARERGRAIQEHKRKEKVLDSCKWCFESKELQRHLIVAVGAKSFVCLPPYQSLTEGHCLIIPLHHTTCSTQLDEDVWEEIQDFRKALVRMFAAEDEDCVLFESAMYLNKFPHMVLHCVPLPREIGDMAPIYFKKAILECEMEWSTNKKLVDLSKKDIRHSVPKGLPYFAVDFGAEGGFAHVIEEEKSFPSNFAQEIIGGMMDLDHSIWRKPRMEKFDKQRCKVLEFSKKWRNFDFTKKSNSAKRMKMEDSDSSDSLSS